jgi:hypothetical protein
MEQLENRKRVVIESLEPQIDSGQFSIKRTIGEKVKVHANIFCDGHDYVRAERLNKSKIRESVKLSDEITTTVPFYGKYDQSFSSRSSPLDIVIFRPDGGDAE